MRLGTRKPHAPGREHGRSIDGYAIANVVAHRSDTELVCETVGPDGEPVSVVVAWRPPHEGHSWPRFRRMARTRAGLRHPALVPVRAVGEHDGRPYLAMDRYPATTFEDLLEDAPLAPGRVLPLLAPACEALDLAHAHGLVHQTLVGSSLLVDGDALLLDGFGVAGGPPQLHFESIGLQEVRHCAPEELRGQQLEPASNVYTLTSLLVHALTGAPPYAGTPAEQAYGHLVEPAPQPSVHMPQLGRAFDDLIARGMAKDPAERPGSARELLEEAAVALGVDLPALRGFQEADEPEPSRRAAIRLTRVPRWAVIAAMVAAASAGVVAAVVADPFGGTRTSAASPGADATTVERLDRQRTALRAQLAAGETPQDQADAAAELAAAYGEAARAAGSRGLAAAAREAERAYRSLAASAGDGSAEGFAAAGESVERAESHLDAAAAAVAPG
jgi:serine/threonine-protein kinase